VPSFGVTWLELLHFVVRNDDYARVKAVALPVDILDDRIGFERGAVKGDKSVNDFFSRSGNRSTHIFPAAEAHVFRQQLAKAALPVCRMKSAGLVSLSHLRETPHDRENSRPTKRRDAMNFNPLSAFINCNAYRRASRLLARTLIADGVGATQRHYGKRGVACICSGPRF
jgi:hypothetical protein